MGVEPIELPGGHFPMLESPALLAGVLERVSVAGARPEPGHPFLRHMPAEAKATTGIEPV